MGERLTREDEVSDSSELTEEKGNGGRCLPVSGGWEGPLCGQSLRAGGEHSRQQEGQIQGLETDLATTWRDATKGPSGCDKSGIKVLPSSQSWAQYPPYLTLLPGFGELREGGRWREAGFCF